MTSVPFRPSSLAAKQLTSREALEVLFESCIVHTVALCHPLFMGLYTHNNGLVLSKGNPDTGKSDRTWTELAYKSREHEFRIEGGDVTSLQHSIIRTSDRQSTSEINTPFVNDMAMDGWEIFSAFASCREEYERGSRPSYVGGSFSC